ncbi:MAG: DinB family protein [Candidatus Acidiferrales bacterium]
MSEINRILDQMDRAFSGEAWHGPDLTQLLNGISSEDASKHPVPGAHSIWELVNHIAAWNTIVQQKSKGEPVEVTTELDWPPVWEVSEVSWKRSLATLVENRTRLRNHVKTVRDGQLDERVQRENYSQYVLLHGSVQHDLYHAGQIAVLKKALA